MATWSVRRREGGESGGGGGGRRGGSSGGDLGAFLNRLCVVLAAVAVQVGREGREYGGKEDTQHGRMEVVVVDVREAQ